jgi:hypothetical protein
MGVKLHFDVLNKLLKNKNVEQKCRIALLKTYLALTYVGYCAHINQRNDAQF